MKAIRDTSSFRVPNFKFFLELDLPSLFKLTFDVLNLNEPYQRDQIHIFRSFKLPCEQILRGFIMQFYMFCGVVVTGQKIFFFHFY